jgi:hypothetical protein
VASRVEHGMLLCEFKRITPVHAEAPVDYVRAAPAPRLRATADRRTPPAAARSPRSGARAAWRG